MRSTVIQTPFIKLNDHINSASAVAPVIRGLLADQCHQVDNLVRQLTMLQNTKKFVSKNCFLTILITLSHLLNVNACGLINVSSALILDLDKIVATY